MSNLSLTRCTLDQKPPQSGRFCANFDQENILKPSQTLVSYICLCRSKTYFPKSNWKVKEMNEVSAIACPGCSWQHFTLFWSPSPSLVSDSTRHFTRISPRTRGGTRSCHAVASSGSPQAKFIKTSNGAASNGTNIALCHHYFNNFEYFEYFNHWVTPWMPGLIFHICFTLN